MRLKFTCFFVKEIVNHYSSTLMNMFISSRRKTRTVITATTFFVILLGLFQPSPISASVRNVSIAFQGPLSGEEAQVGRDELDGVKFAVWHFNQAFKDRYNVSVVEVDDRGDPARAAVVAPGVSTNLSVLGLVGASYSGASIASLPFYKAQNLVMISPSATRVSLTDPQQGSLGYPVFHRVVGTDKVQGPALVRVATEGVSNPRIFIVDDQSAYGVGLVDYMKPSLRSGQAVGFDSVSDRTTDWSPTVSKIRISGANVVIFAGYFPQAAQFITQLRANGYLGIIAGGDGVLSPSLLSLASRSALEGLRMTAGTVPLGELSSSLEENFKKVIGRSSGIYATESIDATNVLLYCIANGVTTRSQMLNCVDNFDGKSVFGSTFRFDENGDKTPNNFYSFEVRSGAIYLRDTFERSRLTSQEIVEEFPWYSIIRAETEAAAKAEAEARARAQAEATAKAQSDALARAELEARLKESIRNRCIQYNGDIEVASFTARNAAVTYPASASVFDGIVKIAPPLLDCSSLNLVTFDVEFEGKQKLLSTYQVAITNAIVAAQASSKKVVSITCVKGKLRKIVKGTSPKCPSGFRKK